MMISGRHQKVGITDLNIAINYLVIERILTCTGLYHTIKEKLDIEAGNIGIYGAIVKEEKDITPKESSEEDNIETEKTDILDVIFQKAKNGTLREHFESLQKIDEDTYKKFIKLLQDILNVDESIITGTKANRLGHYTRTRNGEFKKPCILASYNIRRLYVRRNRKRGTD